MGEINLSFYKNKDFSVYYSLTKLSNYITKMMLQSKTLPFSSDYIPKDVKYFMNPLRKNLVNWIEFSKEDEILDVNDVFGIMAEDLCDKVKNVTMVEFSGSIASITNNVLQDKNNLEIIVGEFRDIKFNKKFDYIFLADVLEASKVFFGKDFSALDFINYFKNLLKPKGKLIINISNQLGIKNWAGAVEEHFGKIYGSLKNYSGISMELFSQKNLKDMLEQAGFQNIELFYPVPTHYCPSKLIPSTEVVEKETAKLYQNYSLNFEKSSFNEKLIMEDIIDNDKFYLFVNSYMFIAEKGDCCE